MKTILSSFFIFIFFFVAKAQQDSLNDLSFQIGFGLYGLNEERYSFDDFRNDFPVTGVGSKDFSTYHPDTANEHFGIAPINIRFDYGFKANLGKSDIFKNARYRVMVEYSRFEMAYFEFLEEKLTDKVVNGNDTVSWDFYNFIWNTRSVSLGFGLHLHTRYFGKNKRNRVWSGLNIMNGIAVNRGRKYHSKGLQPGRYSNTTNRIDEYDYTGPVISSSQTEVEFSLGTNYFLGCQVPLGYEHVFGKERNFIFGVQSAFGKGILFSENSNIPFKLNGMVYHFRFFI